nr:hypothetical protein [Oceanivirga sp.]
MKKYKKYVKPAVITSVILLIPFFYVFFFLKAFWNPYDNISNIPVAVVNLDNGEVGKEIVKKLEESRIQQLKNISINADEIESFNEQNERISTLEKKIRLNTDDNSKLDDKLTTLKLTNENFILENELNNSEIS